MLLLLAPMMALAQGMPISDEALNQQVTHSPLFWSWVVMLAVAIVAFAIYTLYLSKHRQPPDRPVAP
ncbi:hypothetical protein MEBOL_006974 [Melittangium boletus DSM 14713]|uniref:Uncharacterized protein n=2 Tax=Melittangium boletus TaxID=83453 RepID=A0A250IRB8_9BACT|nr:hypothetical protein MEBOL_006974 [Melittangium boletus DSM 14713]